MIKKILICCLMTAFLFLIDVGDAYSLQVIVDGQSITIEKNAGDIITLNILRDDCLGWEVEPNSVVIEDDVFVMPESDVVVTAIIPTEYLLSTGVSEIIIESNQPVGTEVAIRTISESEINFGKWLSSGMILSNPSNSTLSFVMPYNDVRLNGSYKMR